MNTDKFYAESIAKEYAIQDTSKVIALRKLDRKAKSAANIFAYSFGTVAALTLGTGLCLAMRVIGSDLAAPTALGAALGAIGIIGVSVNYPIYKRLLAAGKKKYAFEIMTLAKEISEAVG